MSSSKRVLGQLSSILMIPRPRKSTLDPLSSALMIPNPIGPSMRILGPLVLQGYFERHLGALSERLV